MRSDGCDRGLLDQYGEKAVVGVLAGRSRPGRVIGGALDQSRPAKMRIEGVRRQRQGGSDRTTQVREQVFHDLALQGVGAGIEARGDMLIGQFTGAAEGGASGSIDTPVQMLLVVRARIGVQGFAVGADVAARRARVAGLPIVAEALFDPLRQGEKGLGGVEVSFDQLG